MLPPALTLIQDAEITISKWNEKDAPLMSTFVYVLVFVVCSPGCVTTTSNQTFANQQQCFAAAALLTGVQSATCQAVIPRGRYFPMQLDQ